jgi:hypothetical protein
MGPYQKDGDPLRDSRVSMIARCWEETERPARVS